MTPKSIRRGLVTVGALLLGLAVTATAWADMFYREEAKDGRIYVFAIAKEYAAWSKSGEVGKAITKLGYGPNGETIVFDSEDAVNLYNFKNNKPGEVFVKAPEAPKPVDSFSVKVGGTIYADYTYTDAPKISDADKNSVHKSEFEVRRAYINVTGTINDFIAFRITPDVAARQTTTVTQPTLPPGTPAPILPIVTGSLDGSLDFRLKYGYGQFNLDKINLPHGSWIRIGQQQTPYVDYMENIYRYRFQGTIFPEREGFLSSSDVGLSGRLAFPRDYGDIHLGYYNGDTYSRAEANDQKAFQIRGTLRPLPANSDFKGLRIALFYDHDSPVQKGKRDRFIVAPTFEHKYVVLGYEYLDAKDRASGLATKPTEADGKGWSLWVEPRTTTGLEALFRYDDLKPGTVAKFPDAKKKRTLFGLSYWFKLKAPLAVSILGDYEEVKYDAALAKPTEKRFELKTLFNF
jgi:hypothetical protein